MKRSMASALAFDNVIETVGNTPPVYSKSHTVQAQSGTSHLRVLKNKR